MGRMKDGVHIDAAYEKNRKVNWNGVQFLLAEANYGGRVTDDLDRRLIKIYAKDIFEDELITAENWKPKGTEEYNYHYPAIEVSGKQVDASMYDPQFFYGEILIRMDDSDHPAAFGQHINAEITSQIMDSKELLDSILSLQPQDTTGSGEDSGSSKITDMIINLSQDIPEPVDVTALKYKFRNDHCPLSVVLIQEVQRYNILLQVLKNELEQLEMGIKGLVVITSELEAVMASILIAKVPASWGFAYFSMKNLGNWIIDLQDRYGFFSQWAATKTPFVFWISAFTYPTGFTTSLLQRFSRKSHGAPIDRLEFDFITTPRSV